MTTQDDVASDLAPARIQALLRTERYGRSLRVLSETDSTNDDARQDALAGAPDGHVVIADSQRAGRGSHGRVWASPAGSDLYLSIVARPTLSLADLPPLTLAVGMGVADAVESALQAEPRQVQVKWPNDVWLLGKKCGGILVEASSTANSATHVVIGIGLNVNRLQWPPEIESIATSLRASRGTAAPLDRGQVFAHVLGSVERWVARLSQEGSAAIVGALEARLALRGRNVRCEGVYGTLVGIAPSGAARIATQGGVRELVAGRLELAE